MPGDKLTLSKSDMDTALSKYYNLGQTLTDNSYHLKHTADFLYGDEWDSGAGFSHMEAFESWLKTFGVALGDLQELHMNTKMSYQDIVEADTIASSDIDVAMDIG